MEYEYKNSLLKGEFKKIKSLTKNLEHKMPTHKTSLGFFPTRGNPRQQLLPVWAFDNSHRLFQFAF